MEINDQKPNLGNQTKLVKYLLFSLIGLQIILLGATIVVLKNHAAYQADPNQRTSFIPIWMAIFIPLIATIRQPHSDRGKRIWLWLLVGLAILVLLGMLAVLIKTLG